MTEADEVDRDALVQFYAARSNQLLWIENGAFTGKARAVRFSTLDALCRELDCQPGDLLVHEPGPGDAFDDDADT
ncbi:MAG: helix-turn-helix domain-containing protein [Brevundimonas sp.]